MLHSLLSQVGLVIFICCIDCLSTCGSPDWMFTRIYFSTKYRWLVGGGQSPGTLLKLRWSCQGILYEIKLLDLWPICREWCRSYLDYELVWIIILRWKTQKISRNFNTSAVCIDLVYWLYWKTCTLYCIKYLESSSNICRNNP